MDKQKDIFDNLRDLFTNERVEDRTKKFWSMKQLDRIEYFLLKNDIRYRNRAINFLSSLETLLFINFFVLIIAFNSYLAMDSKILFEVCETIMKVSLFVLGAMLFVDLVTIVNRKIMFNRLDKRFLDKK